MIVLMSGVRDSPSSLEHDRRERFSLVAAAAALAVACGRGAVVCLADARTERNGDDL